MKKLLLAGIFCFVLFVGGFVVYKHTINPPDTQCTLHDTTSVPPTETKTADDYFTKGNYEYDRGNCAQAIQDYTQAIDMNGNFAESYNNRAYTYMRMRDYKNALSDVNAAIEIRPDYVHALMNRGDIYNFYLTDRPKALADYNTVLTLVKDQKERQKISVCGHKLIAQNNGWGLNIYWYILTHGGLNAGC